MSSAGLIIGINYINTPQIILRGCWNDAMTMYSLLSSDMFDYDTSSMEILLDNVRDQTFIRNKTSKSNIVKLLYKLAIKSWSENLKKVFFIYSGHGSYTNDLNGDEVDGKDEGLCPADCQISGLLLDDEILEIFNMFNPSTMIYVMIDCCHSGSILDLPYKLNDKSDSKKSMLIKPHIVVLSGCQDSETAAESYDPASKKISGVLTNVLNEYYSKEENKNDGIIDTYNKLCKVIKEKGYCQNIVVSSSKPITNDIKMFM